MILCEDKYGRRKKAILSLKQMLRLEYNDNSITRAPEYEILKGGHTMFFRNGKGDVYEILPSGNFINSYTEDYLDEALILDKYQGMTLTEADTNDFLSNEDLRTILSPLRNTWAKKDVVRATLIALGYDKEWIKDILEPKLNALTA